MFQKILIANRGEIAVRIARACRELGIASVAVFSDADRLALHVLRADEALRLGPAAPAESYLSVERLLAAARQSGADALHPGYGFLAEDAALAEACARAGIVFIGPSPAAMALMGSKTAARALAVRCGVPLLDGSAGALASPEEARRRARELGYPVMLKAAAGGGGKGMRLIEEETAMDSAVALARAEAQAAFGNGDLYLEKALARPRHIEMQVLADGRGQVIYLGERDCSVQRRHQKVVEESPVLGPATRRAMGEAAVTLCRAGGYANAGTVEFLVDETGRFYFLEVNARLQVEHPVTEMVTGIDLVREQIAIAAGAPLRWRQEEVALRGHAIECRVYAEDPEQGFFPSAGTITRWRPAGGPGIREDCGIYEGWTVPLEYDPLLTKLIAWGEDRAQAIARMRGALAEYQVAGVRTNLDLFRRVFNDPEFIAGGVDTAYLARLMQASLPAQPGLLELAAAAVAASLAAAGAAPHGANHGAKDGVGNGIDGGQDRSAWRRAARWEALRSR